MWVYVGALSCLCVCARAYAYSELLITRDACCGPMRSSHWLAYEEHVLLCPLHSHVLPLTTHTHTRTHTHTSFAPIHTGKKATAGRRPMPRMRTVTCPCRLPPRRQNSSNISSRASLCTWPLRTVATDTLTHSLTHTNLSPHTQARELQQDGAPCCGFPPLPPRQRQRNAHVVYCQEDPTTATAAELLYARGPNAWQPQ